MSLLYSKYMTLVAQTIAFCIMFATIWQYLSLICVESCDRRRTKTGQILYFLPRYFSLVIASVVLKTLIDLFRLDLI